jgi:hypothetical protein
MASEAYNIANPLKSLSWAIRSNIIVAVKVGMREAEYISKIEFLSGQGRAKTILNRRSGRLYNSVKGVGRGGPAGFIASGSLYSEGVEYADIHETGGIIYHPGSTARNRIKMKFFWKKIGKIVFASKTKAHNIPIPQRSFIERAMRKLEPWMEDALDRAVKSAHKNS